MIAKLSLYSLLFLLLLAGLPFNSYAQQPYHISGSVLDSANKTAVDYATVAVFDKTNTAIATGFTDAAGSFKLVVKSTGSYKIRISYVGYQTFERQIDLLYTNIDLGQLLLSATGSMLSEIKISGTKQLIVQKPGKLVYNVQNDPGNKGGTATDVLRKAPILQVDAQGNVSMRGSGSIKILINGKYSGQMAKSPADALNMIPASIISSVEIITTPSAKYDAEGAAGVINIITKKNRKDISGAIELAGSNLEQVINPRVAIANGKWDFSLNAHLHRLRSKSSTLFNRTSYTDAVAQNALQQQINKDNAAPHGSTDLTLNFAPDSLNQFSLGITSWFGNWPDNSRLNSRLSNGAGMLLEDYNQNATTKNNYFGGDFNLGYTKKLAGSSRELSILAQFSPGKDNSFYQTTQFGLNDQLLYKELNNGHTRNKEYTLQADYNHPFDSKGKFNMEAGVKWIGRKVTNSYDVSEGVLPDPKMLIPSPSRSDIFKYQQDVYSGYAQFKYTPGRNLFLQAGVRYEDTYLHGSFAQNGSPFSKRFNNIVPSATILKKLTENQTLSLSYTQRITRPYIWDISPNANASDPKNVVSGNPELQPEITHQTELSYNLSGKDFNANVSLFWKQTNNGIIDFTQTYASGSSLTTKQNLAGNRQYGLNLSATFKPLPKWSLNGNANTGYLNFSSPALHISSKGWVANFNLNTIYNLPKNYAIQAFGDFQTREVTLQGFKSNVYYYSIGAKKEFTSPKVSLSFSAINPFSASIAQAETVNGVGFISTRNERYFNRAFKVSLAWEFGKLFEPKARKKVSNDDVKSDQKG